MPAPSPAPRRVLIVGAGAAGIAAASSLCRVPQRFAVEVWEAADRPGGVATTETLANGQRINDGVQGGALSYRNSLLLHASVGFHSTPVHMTVSFGKGPWNWNNYSHKPMLDNLGPEIKRFGDALRRISFFELLFIFIPIRVVLWLFGFSTTFAERMVYPLTALFFGTGNQTPNVSSAVVARVFLDANLRLFDYDEKSLLAQQPEMLAFPPLADVYSALASALAPAGKVFCSRALVCIDRKSKPGLVLASDANGVTAEFDALIMACDAESALKVLGTDAGYWERSVLGAVEYYSDVTITHTDDSYMHKHYDVSPGDQYFIRTDPERADKLEMSFCLSNYQPAIAQGCPLFQTIFLDKNESSRWTVGEIEAEKVLLKKWWRQFSHTWRHFFRVVPWVRLIQGCRNNTFYCGSWTLVNTHEIAVISGLAAAHRLGAPYPFASDPLATQQFSQYLSLIHAIRWREK